jgi:RNA-directed DNA polymerase
MKESYVEGLAAHSGPESCVAVRKGGGEALTGVRAGRVSSRESEFLWGADAVEVRGRQQPVHRHRKMGWYPARSQTPCMSGNTLGENREVRCPPAEDGLAGRVGKSKDAHR